MILPFFRKQLERERGEAFEGGYKLGYQMCKSDMTGKGFITGCWPPSGKGFVLGFRITDIEPPSEIHHLLESVVNAQIMEIMSEQRINFDKEDCNGKSYKCDVCDKLVGKVVQEFDVRIDNIGNVDVMVGDKETDLCPACVTKALKLALEEIREHFKEEEL